MSCKLPVKERDTPEKNRNEHWKDIASEAAKEIRKSRKPFEDAIAEKRKRLQLLSNYIPCRRVEYRKAFPDKRDTMHG